MHSYAALVAHEAAKPQASFHHNPRKPNSWLTGLNSAAVQTYVDVNQNTGLNSLAPCRFGDCVDNCFVVDTHHDVRFLRQLHELANLDRVCDLIGNKHALDAVTYQTFRFGDRRASHANRASSQLTQGEVWALVVLEMRTQLGAAVGEEGCHFPQI